MTIAQLNSDFGLNDQLRFVEGQGGFPMMEISNGLAKARISVYGGQVLAFQPVTEATEVLFLSPAAYHATGKAIKGGAPVCWPWFGPDPEDKGRPSHGFVRNRMWEVRSTEALAGGGTKVVLGIQSSEETLEIWPHGFDLAIAITVAETLTIGLTTHNTGDNAFSITQALHTYFTVGDIGKVQVNGLADRRYIDKVDGGTEKTQAGTVNIGEEVDRIYLNVPSTLVIEDAALDRHIKVDSEGSRTAVVWNPWSEISVRSGDLEDESYKGFICVETVNAADEVIEVAAGATYKLVATYAVGPI